MVESWSEATRLMLMLREFNVVRWDWLREMKGKMLETQARCQALQAGWLKKADQDKALPYDYCLNLAIEDYMKAGGRARPQGWEHEVKRGFEQARTWAMLEYKALSAYLGSLTRIMEANKWLDMDRESWTTHVGKEEYEEISKKWAKDRETKMAEASR